MEGDAGQATRGVVGRDGAGWRGRGRVRLRMKRREGIRNRGTHAVICLLYNIYDTVNRLEKGSFEPYIRGM